MKLKAKTHTNRQTTAYDRPFPPLMLKTLGELGERPLFHFLHEGTQSTITARQAKTWIEHGAYGLKTLGVKRNVMVGIMFKPSPHWILAEQMCMILGGVSVGIYDNITLKSLEHYIQQTRLNIVFIDSLECYNKLLNFRTQLRTLIVKDELYSVLKRKTSAKAFKLLSWSQLIAAGAAAAQAQPQQLNKELAALKGSQLAAIIYTSGSLGMPKGVMLEHKDFVYQITAVAKHFHMINETDIALSVLPVAHTFERTVIYFYMSLKLTIYMLSDPTQLRNVIGTVRPTILTAVPRLLERVHEATVARAAKRPFPLRHLAQHAFAYAAKRNPLNPLSSLAKIYDRLVYKKVRVALGDSLKFIISGGAPLDAQTISFFFSIGIPVYEGYGLTETAPVISANTAEHFKPCSIGRPLSGTRVKISPQGELIVQTPSLMRGYFKLPGLTRRVIQRDANGRRWLHTGDKGRIEAGFIFLEGRIKEFFKTSTGKYVNPVIIEKQLTNHPAISHALVIGERRKFVSALLFVDPQFLPKATVAARATLADELLTWIVTVNKNFESWQHVQKIKLVWQELSIAANDLTPKLSIKRGELEVKFKTLIDAFYH